MIMDEKLQRIVAALLKHETTSMPSPDDFREVCEYVNVSKMYYRISFDTEGKYRDPRNNMMVIFGKQADDDAMVLYSDGKKTDFKLEFPYYFGGAKFCDACIEFPEGVTRDELNMETYEFLADVVYPIVSRRNTLMMVDFAENRDLHTGIPNGGFIRKQYDILTKTVPAHQYAVLFINVQNFKYLNETAGNSAGDEAIVVYAHFLMKLAGDKGVACRLGGDNFMLVVLESNLEKVMAELKSVTVKDMRSAPGKTFELSPWIGISHIKEGQESSFVQRQEEASIACMLGKKQLNENIVVYSDDLKSILKRGKEMVAMFFPAIEKGEIFPYFQPKVDMRTGKLTGFEALARWVHEGRFIYPDQFIPVLSNEGLVPELDIAIFRQTCAHIRKWKDEGLNPPRISSNISKNTLFMPDVEKRILSIIEATGISVDDIEIEITETVKEFEYNRLIEFVGVLHKSGIRISIDDFGTGYSSLSLIHNIEADVIKLDKSFIDTIIDSSKSKILISTVIDMSNKLGMDVIAEGVETTEQGKMLMEMGCYIAQGYYYSKPVDRDTAEDMIRNDPFKGIA